MILQLPPHALCPAGQTPISRSHTLGHTPKISRFHQRFQDFTKISRFHQRFHEDFKISPKISRFQQRFQDFSEDFKISPRFQDFKGDFKISVEISAVVYEISASGGPLASYYMFVCLGYGWVGYFTFLFFLISLKGHDHVDEHVRLSGYLPRIVL